MDRDYEAQPGRLGTLNLVCKACKAELELEQKAREGQTIQCPDCELTCPLCGATDIYGVADFHLKFD